MTLTDIWGRFTAFLLRFVDPSAEAWRKRRDAMAPRSKPTYDVYPDRELPPQIRLYVEARDARGRLLREYVELEGYSLHQLNWRPNAMRGGVLVRDWFTGQVLEAMVNLAVRLDSVKEQKGGTR
jgi:hypothetical protein